MLVIHFEDQTMLNDLNKYIFFYILNYFHISNNLITKVIQLHIAVSKISVDCACSNLTGNRTEWLKSEFMNPATAVRGVKGLICLYPFQPPLDLIKISGSTQLKVQNEEYKTVKVEAS